MQLTPFAASQSVKIDYLYILFIHCIQCEFILCVSKPTVYYK